MCLSTIYQNEIGDNKVLASNVQKVDCTDTEVILTDLFERQIRVKGKIVSINLNDNYVIIKTEE